MKILLNNCSLGDHTNVNILIEDNIFTQISTEIIRVETDLTFDLSRKLVLPGIIDLNQDLFGSLDTFDKIRKESQALIKSGITSLINIERSHPSQNLYDVEALNKLSLTNLGETSIIDFFSDNVDKNNYIFNTLNIGEVDEENDSKEYGEWFQNRILEIQGLSKILFVSMKDSGLGKFLKYVPKNDYKICFFDFSTPSEIARIVNFKKQGFNFYIAFDVNLFFLYKELIKSTVDKKRYSNTSGYSSSRDIKFFVDCLKKGFIDIVYSNHSPNMLWEKYELNKLGIPSAETLLPLMLELATYSNVGIKNIWKVLCDNPSEILELNNRGKIEVGYYADLIVIDPEKFWYISNNDIHSNAKWTPYEGKRVWGMPIMTILNGNIVYDLYDGITFAEEEYISNFIDNK